jgi:hypothetical protein
MDDKYEERAGRWVRLRQWKDNLWKIMYFREAWSDQYHSLNQSPTHSWETFIQFFFLSLLRNLLKSLTNLLNH